MASLNALRGLLVAGAAGVGVLAAIGGRWSVSALMLIAVAVHGVATLWLRQRRSSQALAPAGTVAPGQDPPAG